MPDILINPLLFLAVVLLIGYFLCPHDVYILIYFLNTVVGTFIVWPLKEYMSLDKGTFGCSLDHDPRAISPAHISSPAAASARHSPSQRSPSTESSRRL